MIKELIKRVKLTCSMNENELVEIVWDEEKKVYKIKDESIARNKHLAKMLLKRESYIINSLIERKIIKKESDIWKV